MPIVAGDGSHVISQFDFRFIYTFLGTYFIHSHLIIHQPLTRYHIYSMQNRPSQPPTMRHIEYA